MKPLKRFFLYCFYCTIAYFTKGHPAHGAYKTSLTITHADSGVNHLCNVYTTSYNKNCEEFSVGEANSKFEGYFSSTCDATGISNIVYSKSVLCKTVTENEDGKCTLTNCSWDCELSCASGSWGKTILYTEINNVCPSADEVGPACPENKKYSSTSLDGWCNICPAHGTCSAETFECVDGYGPNRTKNECEVACSGEGVKSCEGSKITACHSGYWNAGGNSCAICEEYEICPEGQNMIGCDTSYTGTGGAGYGQGLYLWAGSISACYFCPENATCDDGINMTCNYGYLRQAHNVKTDMGTEYTGEQQTHQEYKCQKCDENTICSGNDIIACAEGYWLKDERLDTSCTYCGEGVKKCNVNGALSCMANWYLNGYTCVKCPDNATCTDAGFTCNDGYWKSKNKDSCEKDLANATCVDGVGCACHSGYYRSGEVCATCPANHYTCAGDSFTCKVGYYKSGGACPECPDAGAAVCDENGTTTQCKDGYLLKEEHCYGCGENAKCENGQFISCKSSGFFGDENGCYACPANATCNGSSTGVCNAGYYGTVLHDGDTCQLCPELGNAVGYSEMGSNTNICNCYLPVWKYENGQWGQISYTDDIGEFYFYSELGDGADNDAYKNELVPATQCTTE